MPLYATAPATTETIFHLLPNRPLFALAGLLFLVGGRAISEYTKTDRLSAEGLGIGLAVVCAVIGMLAKDAADNLDDEGSAPQ